MPDNNTNSNWGCTNLNIYFDILAMLLYRTSLFNVRRHFTLIAEFPKLFTYIQYTARVQFNLKPDMCPPLMEHKFQACLNMAQAIFKKNNLFLALSGSLFFLKVAF